VALDLAGADADEKWEEPEIDTIFVLSDGRPSVGLSTDADEILALVKERNEAAGITIHTIGLSGAQDAYLLRSLAEQNGGTYAAR
jgi:Mg-chelatase subunit ChlD